MPSGFFEGGTELFLEVKRGVGTLSLTIDFSFAISPSNSLMRVSFVFIVRSFAAIVTLFAVIIAF